MSMSIAWLFFCTDVLPELQSIFVLARKATHKHSNSRSFSRDDHLPTDLPLPGLLGTCLVDKFKFFRVLWFSLQLVQFLLAGSP